MKDARIKLGKEECALGMDQKSHSEGCTNIVVKGGVCIKHGARVEYTRCKSKGCTNFAIKERVCIKHGAKYVRKKCSKEGCTKYAQNTGVCFKHGAKMNRHRSKLSRGGKKNLKRESGLWQSEAASHKCFDE